jgi:hypothetical protein
MNLQVCEIRRPDERRKVVDDDVIDIRLTTSPRYWNRLHPLRGKRRRILLVEMLALHTIRISLQGHGSVVQVWQKPLRDTNVVVDDMCFGYTCRRVKKLIEVGYGHVHALDVQRLLACRLPCHCGFQGTTALARDKEAGAPAPAGVAGVIVGLWTKLRTWTINTDIPSSPIPTLAIRTAADASIRIADRRTSFPASPRCSHSSDNTAKKEVRSRSHVLSHDAAAEATAHRFTKSRVQSPFGGNAVLPSELLIALPLERFAADRSLACVFPPKRVLPTVT